MEANAEYGDYSGWSSSFSTYISFIIYYSYIFMCYSLPVELYFMYIERSNATIVVALYTQKYSVGPNLNVISVVRNTLVMLVILKKTIYLAATALVNILRPLNCDQNFRIKKKLRLLWQINVFHMAKLLT